MRHHAHHIPTRAADAGNIVQRAIRIVEVAVRIGGPGGSGRIAEASSVASIRSRYFLLVDWVRHLTGGAEVCSARSFPCAGERLLAETFLAVNVWMKEI